MQWYERATLPMRPRLSGKVICIACLTCLSLMMRRPGMNLVIERSRYVFRGPCAEHKPGKRLQPKRRASKSRGLIHLLISM